MKNESNRFNAYQKRFGAFKAEEPQAKGNEILIYGRIAEFAFFEDAIVTPKSILGKLSELEGEDEITVRINSPGGDVFAGIAIYNAFVRSESKINIKIDGLAASAASLVAMSGDSIEMADNSAMMIHEPWTFAIGSRHEMLEVAEVLEKITIGMSNTYSARSGQSKEECMNIMEAETWYTADEAVDKGFADSIKKSKEKPDHNATACDLSVFANVPDWVKDQYSLEDPPAASGDDPANIDPPPKSYYDNKRKQIQILDLT